MPHSETGTATATSDCSKPLFPKALSHLHSLGRAGVRTLLSWSCQQFQVFGSGQGENPFAFQPLFVATEDSKQFEGRKATLLGHRAFP